MDNAKPNKDDATRKAEINAILEKYNLKSPKRSKTNITPSNFEIKPKNPNQVIHIAKTSNSTNTTAITTFANKDENVNIKSPPTTTQTTLTTPTTSSPPIPSLNKIIHKGNQSAPTITIAPLPSAPSPPTSAPPAIKTIVTSSTKSSSLNKITPRQTPSPIANKEIQVKALLDKDNQRKEAEKNAMPTAIISNGRGGFNKSNIYNFIPTVSSQSSSLQTSLAPVSSSSPASARIIKSNNYNHSGGAIVNQKTQPQSRSQNQPKSQSQIQPQSQIKTVTINPNLNEEQSLNYKGESINSPVDNTLKVILPRRKPGESSSTPDARTPSPIRNIAILNKLNSTQASNPLQNHLQNQPQKTQSRESTTITDVIISPELQNLENQRRELQKQQLLELQRFKAKKAEIIHLNNRKREMELMRSIEDEKNKLRMIHAKQVELNNIYKATVESTQNGSGGITQKNIIYNVDAKRTKKNIPATLIDVVPSNSNTKKVSFKEPIKESSNITNQPLEQSAIPETSNQPDEHIPKQKVKLAELPKIETKESKNSKDKTKDIKSTKVVKEVKLEYYSKKDKPDLKWPNKNELYDSSTYETPINIYLATVPILNRKQLKCKLDIATIKKELIEDYGFTKLEKFKEPLLELIYKIITYDRIRFAFD